MPLVIQTLYTYVPLEPLDCDPLCPPVSSNIATISNSGPSSLKYILENSGHLGVTDEAATAIKICVNPAPRDPLATGPLHASALKNLKDHALNILLGPAETRDPELSRAAERLWDVQSMRRVLVHAFHGVKEGLVRPGDPEDNIGKGLLELFERAKDPDVLKHGLSSEGNEHRDAVWLVERLAMKMDRRFGAIDFVQHVAKNDVGRVIQARAVQLGHFAYSDKFTSDMAEEVVARIAARDHYAPDEGRAPQRFSGDAGRVLNELHKLPDRVIDKAGWLPRPPIREDVLGAWMLPDNAKVDRPTRSLPNKKS